MRRSPSCSSARPTSRARSTPSRSTAATATWSSRGSSASCATPWAARSTPGRPRCSGRSSPASSGSEMSVPRLGLLPERAAGRAAGDDAVVLDGERRTWEELVAASARIAGLLDSFGVRPGDRVALLTRKSVRAVDALYGILRAGAAYVPLDPFAPPARHAAIAGDSGARVV